jgi:hypothetical protein
MATFLSSALVCLALFQAPEPAARADSLAVWRGRAARDSTDAQLWLLVGRAYLELGAEAHGSTHRPAEDSAWTRAVLDSADGALLRAASLAGPAGTSTVGDSARVLRVGTWAARSWLAWEQGGIDAGQAALGPLPTDLRVPPVLEELGENLLRGCPSGGVLLTAGPADWYATWYMRFVRGLRPDLILVPPLALRSDVVLRRRLAGDLKLGHQAEGGAWLGAVARRRPVCASMAFERPPDRVKWETRPLEWVAGAQAGNARVPAREFVFAALRVALDQHDPWAEPALAAYGRAARTTPALCEAMATFKVAGDVAACRR